MPQPVIWWETSKSSKSLGKKICTVKWLSRCQRLELSLRLLKRLECCHRVPLLASLTIHGLTQVRRHATPTRISMSRVLQAKLARIQTTRSSATLTRCFVRTIVVASITFSWSSWLSQRLWWTTTPWCSDNCTSMIPPWLSWIWFFAVRRRISPYLNWKS